MYYKNYGDTNIRVSAIGMGCMRYDEEDVKAGRYEKCAETALYALEKGINYFDTAPFYCNDKSEMITGLALSQVDRSKFFVSSKANIGTTGDVVNAKTFRKRLETTLTRLKVDYLDFYHLWCLLSMDSFKEQSDALYDFFVDAKKDGLIKNIVFSAHMEGDELEQIVAKDMFKGMLIGYNALNYRFRQSGIEAAAKKGMGVVVMNPLGGGLIPENPEKFAYLTQGTDMNVAQAALRFVAAHKEITIALAGFTTPAHVDDAVKAVENLEEKPAVELLKQYAEVGMAANDLCTGCGYCRGCPVDIDIPKYMDAYNEKILGNTIENKLKNHWHVPAEKASECIACGVCEEKCTQHLPIIERLAEIAQLA